ncbi:MAG TPA: trypsin-like serine protease, partial [Anaerolineae bacterium]
MLRKVLPITISIFAIIMFGIHPVAAIAHGELDGNGHPYVGLMVALDADGTPLWRCSGTLLSSTIFLTAGHCTEAPAARAQIWFASDVDAGIPGNGYPTHGDVGGTTYTHPQFDPNAFYRFDLGVVVLDSAVQMNQYGALPKQDVLDSLAKRRGLQDV